MKTNPTDQELAEEYAKTGSIIGHFYQPGSIFSWVLGIIWGMTMGRYFARGIRGAMRGWWTP